jgi:hypothetical protein
VPSTSNFGFDYESPSSLPGVTLTGGPTTTSPILAVQVDAALASIETKVDNNSTDIAANTAAIASGSTLITDLQNWTRRGTVLVNFTSLGSFTTAVNFGFTFPTAPVVVTNIDSGAGSTARFETRAITLTTTGFTLFVYTSVIGATATWVDVPVSWIAHYD